MSRYLLAIMGALAVSACADNRPQVRTSPGFGSTPRNETDSQRNAATLSQDEQGSSFRNTTDIPTNNPSRSGHMDGPGMKDLPSNGSQSVNRTAIAPLVTTHEGQKNSPLTAGDQSESDADRRITQLVRQAVVADAALSVKAKNCTIVTIDGVVTLQGSVDTTAERLSIGRKTDAVSGVRRVDNNLEILP